MAHSAVNVHMARRTGIQPGALKADCVGILSKLDEAEEALSAMRGARRGDRCTQPQARRCGPICRKSPRKKPDGFEWMTLRVTDALFLIQHQPVFGSPR